MRNVEPLTIPNHMTRIVLPVNKEKPPDEEENVRGFLGVVMLMPSKDRYEGSHATGQEENVMWVREASLIVREVSRHLRVGQPCG